MQRTTYVFPIVGGRKVEHLLANIEALSITLSPEQMSYLEGVVPFDIGFPGNFIVSRYILLSRQSNVQLAHLPRRVLERT